MFNSELRNEIPIPTLGRACSAFLNWDSTHRPGMEGNFTTALKGPEPALPWLVRILSSSLNHLSQLYGVRIKPCPVLSDIWERSVPPQPPRSALWVEVSLLMINDSSQNRHRSPFRMHVIRGSGSMWILDQITWGRASGKNDTLNK